MTRTLRLWTIDLACPSRPDDERLRALLDAEERARMDRLRLSSARTRFLTAHAAARILLGRLVGRDAAAVRFAREAGGKPRLEGSGPPFNMAHSGDLALLAVGGRTPLGVDVETLRPVPRLEAMIRYACTAPERAMLEAVADEVPRAERFLELWVRKEAVLKAVGLGLREHPARVEVGRGDRPVIVGGLPPTHVRSIRCSGHPAALATLGSPSAYEVMPFDWADAGTFPRTRGRDSK